MNDVRQCSTTNPRFPDSSSCHCHPRHRQAACSCNPRRVSYVPSQDAPARDARKNTIAARRSGGLRRFGVLGL